MDELISFDVMSVTAKAMFTFITHKKDKGPDQFGVKDTKLQPLEKPAELLETILAM